MTTETSKYPPEEPLDEQQEEQLDEQPEEQQEEKKFNPLWVILIVCAVLACVLVCVIAYLNWPKTETLPPVVDDGSWQRILDAGELRVATSADYPPFSYYNDSYQIDGFDAALMSDIGAKLGVPVKISDYAFEGLATVLKIGQADVVIAALAVTPEREALVDFSNIYYISEDGILARVDAEIGEITSPAQMAGMRIGVQKFSIYQKWVQTNLVNTGLIAEGQLFVYAKPEHAVDDLRLGRLDLVIMDAQPATLALASGELALVGRGLNSLRLAIAVPQGSDALRGKINQALLELQNAGRVNELAGIYLGLRPEDIIPPPTPEPTPEATATATVTPAITATPAPCVDGMQFVKDLNYDDEELTNFPKLDPGEAFQKGWQIKNSGTCTWDNSYFIKFVRGNDPAAQMQGQPTSIKGEVKPGQTYDMYVNLVAPANPGKYVGHWQMHNLQNVPFGQTIWVAIEVPPDPAVPTATVTPQATSTPTLAPTDVPSQPTATEVPPQPTATDVPPEPTPTEKPGSDLLEITWVVVGYLADIEDDELTEPINDTIIQLVFGEDDRYRGNAGCNEYNGDYSTDGKNISFTPRNVTKVFCEQPAGLMDQEAYFLGLLDEVEEYRINQDDQLELIIYITNSSNQLEEKILLVFENILQPR